MIGATVTIRAGHFYPATVWSCVSFVRSSMVADDDVTNSIFRGRFPLVQNVGVDPIEPGGVRPQLAQPFVPVGLFK